MPLHRPIFICREHVKYTRIKHVKRNLDIMLDGRIITSGFILHSKLGVMI